MGSYRTLITGYEKIIIDIIQKAILTYGKGRGNGVLITPNVVRRLVPDEAKTSKGYVISSILSILKHFMRCLEKDGVVRIHKRKSSTLYFIPKTSFELLLNTSWLVTKFERCYEESSY